jgi:NADPH:quinone reductase-like Zn-dependent oxidoreductase
MRALIATDAGPQVASRPTPEPAGDEVLVRVAAAGINRADVLQAQGAYPAPPGWPDDILGLEFSGIVEATGHRVTQLAEGDHVYGIVGGGAHATHVLTIESLCARVPEGLDLVEAGAVPEVFITAHDALVTQAGLRSGERVLVNGVGSGVGTAAVQLIKALGATSVGTSRTREKIERAVGLGLDTGVVAGDAMADEIGEVDVVLELVGGDYITTDVQVCRPDGRIMLVGLVAGAEAKADLGAMLRKRITLRGTTLRGRPDHRKALAVAAFEEQVGPLLAAGTLRPVVDRALSLDEAATGYEALKRNETIGKVVIVPEAA